MNKLEALIDELDDLRVPWMWSDELPPNYWPQHYRPLWLEGERRGGVVILRGAKRWHDSDSVRRRDRAWTWVGRACRMFKVTTGYRPRPGESDVLDAIAAKAFKKWPYIRSVKDALYPRSRYERWINGELVFDSELVRVEADLQSAETTELFMRERLIKSITRELMAMRSAK